MSECFTYGVSIPYMLSTVDFCRLHPHPSKNSSHGASAEALCVICNHFNTAMCNRDPHTQPHNRGWFPSSCYCKCCQTGGFPQVGPVTVRSVCWHQLAIDVRVFHIWSEHTIYAVNCGLLLTASKSLKKQLTKRISRITVCYQQSFQHNNVQ